MIRLIPPVAIAAAGAFALFGCTAVQTAAVKTAYAKDLPAGQLFCQQFRAFGPVIVAVADAAGAPIIATGAAEAVVNDACAAVGALPVAPPANLAQAVPVVLAVVTAVTAAK